MIRFNNDYNRGAHPAIWKALQESESESYAGYGTDVWCERAAELILELTGKKDADVHFFPGATQANFVFLAAALKGTESVLSAESGHINCHEAASVENTGHKILQLKEKDGKISAIQVQSVAAAYYEAGEPEFLTEPKVLYISFPTEMGTCYNLRELEELRAVCDRYGMYLFIDGARLGYGLGAPGNDVTMKDLGRLSDAFYIGGTKCGLLFGEAMVLNVGELKRRFKSYMKQNGAVFAKSWLMGLQFYTLLKDGTYFDITKRADILALRIRDAFPKRRIPLWTNSPTNQQFALLTKEQEETIGRDFLFENIGRTESGETIARFCTSWATEETEVDALINRILTIEAGR